jgi:glutamate-1-semialdehyde 2,1-aminomutase
MTHLVGDVSSSARILPDLDGVSLFIERTAGAHVWDDGGRRYIDTALGFGSVLLGHAVEPVTQAVGEALKAGMAPSFAHVREHPAAARLAAHTRDLTRVMFVNSGSEAVHLACRAARAYTGKRTIAKMAAGFDGWFDEVQVGNIGSAEASFSDGARPYSGRTTLLRYNDVQDLERLFAENHDIAAILYEPILANAGCILPQPGYLQALHDTARRHGALLICDEVLMGFRLHAGLTSHLWGLQPDIATVGKALGSGFPVAAVIGRPDVLAPFIEGKVSRGGTYSGNPMACAAITSTLAQLDQQDYAALLRRGDDLRLSIEASFAACGMTVRSSGHGNVFSLWPAHRAPATYGEARAIANNEFSLRLHLALRRHGLLVMPSPYGRLYLSFAHTDEVVDEMKTAFRLAAKDMQDSARRVE